jgi:Homeodomain
MTTFHSSTTKFTAVGALRFKEIFDRNPNPTDEELSDIAEQLGCEKKVIKVKEYNTSK